MRNDADKSLANFTEAELPEYPDWREPAREFLTTLERFDLASLIEHASYAIGREEVWFGIDVPAAKLTAPEPMFSALRALADHDKKRICEALSATDPRISDRAPLERLVVELDTTNLAPESGVMAEVLLEKAQMIDVATGGSRIQDVNDYYRARRSRIHDALTNLGISDPNEFYDLWDWYEKWKADLPSYASRRKYVRDLFAPVLAALPQAGSAQVRFREPTGWERVDRATAKARDRFATAQDEEDFQTVGLLCREVLISVGQFVYDPSRHKAEDGVVPSKTDAARMLDAFVFTELKGSENDAIRRHAKASLKLAVELQHKRTAQKTAAELCLEATCSVASVFAILSRANADSRITSQ